MGRVSLSGYVFRLRSSALTKVTSKKLLSLLFEFIFVELMTPSRFVVSPGPEPF